TLWCARCGRCVPPRRAAHLARAEVGAAGLSKNYPAQSDDRRCWRRGFYRGFGLHRPGGHGRPRAAVPAVVGGGEPLHIVLAVYFFADDLSAAACAAQGHPFRRVGRGHWVGGFAGAGRLLAQNRAATSGRTLQLLCGCAGAAVLDLSTGATAVL